MKNGKFDFVVFADGGRQYFVRHGDEVCLDRVGIEKIERVLLLKVDKRIEIGEPFIKNAVLELDFKGQKKGKKMISFKKKRRKGYHRKVGHRQKYFVYTVKDIAF